MREALYLEGSAINTTGTLVKLIEEAGLDIGMFLEDMKGRDAYRAFLDDKDACAYYQVNGLPAFLIRVGNKETLLRGHQELPVFIDAIHTISDGRYQANARELTVENVLKYFNLFKSACTVELACAFSVQENDLKLLSILNTLLINKKLEMPYGPDAGYYVYIDEDPLHKNCWNR